MKDIEKICFGCMNEVDTEEICPNCGYDKTQPHDAKYLIPGTKIKKRYLVGKVIDTNGEGVTYICYDAKTDKTVTLREYFPIGLCDRNNGAVEVNDGTSEWFTAGLKKFVALYEKIADHPEITSVPGVVDFFEGNGTAYCVLESFESITLREFLLRNGGTLNWEQTAKIFMPLLSTVRALHDIGIVHRGISPETILIGRDGKVRLSGLCIDDVRTMGNIFAAQIFPGYAAVEQYGSIGEQGTWTDVYAMAATMYRVLVGNPPVESIERVTNDTLVIPSNVIDEVPSAVCEALADALQIMPEERTRVIDDFKSYLGTAVVKKKKASAKTKDTDKYRSYVFIAAIMTILVIAIVSAVIYAFVILPNLKPQIPEVSSNISSEDVSAVYSSDISSTESIASGTVMVDNVVGEIYQNLLSDVYYSKYNFIIESKEYSSAYSARKIISQEPQAGVMVDPDINGKITIKIVISLGDYDIDMPDVVGMTEDEAVLALLKTGFNFSNITINEKYDKNAKPLSVISTTPSKGQKINLDSPITITINTYKGETEDKPVSSVQPEEPTQPENTSSVTE